MELLWTMLFLASLMTSFLMSGMEAGVFALSRLRIRQLMRAGNPRAKVLYAYLEKPEDFLWTILVGNTTASFSLISIGVVGMHHWLNRWPAALVIAILLFGAIFYSLSELLPKTLFRMYPNQLCLWMAVPFRIMHFLLRPLVWPTTWLSNFLLDWFGGKRFTGRLFSDRKELRFVIQKSAGDITKEERAMITRVLDLQNLVLRQIAVPMSRVVTTEEHADVSSLIQLLRKHGLSRVPVWRQRGTQRRLVGLVNLTNLLFQPEDQRQPIAADYIKPALFLDADTRLEVALRQMQRTGQRLAIVVRPDRTEYGIVSLRDILKVMFGEVAI